MHWLISSKPKRLDRVYPKIDTLDLTLNKGHSMTQDARKEAETPPCLVNHTLCGNSIFYYFGSSEDAKALKNFNDITTLDGDSITPQEIISCAHCGERIRVDQLQVVERKVIAAPFMMIPTPTDEQQKYIMEQMRKIQQKQMMEQMLRMEHFERDVLFGEYFKKFE